MKYAALPIIFLIIGCDGPQSALEPAGESAEQIAELFWWMAGGATVIWLVVAGLTVYAAFLRPGAHSHNAALLVIGGGAVFPTVVLAVLLGYGLSILPALTAPAKAGTAKITVVGEQWWWRVFYQLPDGSRVELANEVHLAVNEQAGFELESRDVIHSFWIPSLGGKVDMIPGRTTHLALTPTKTGIYRGACAEYCGSSHALMNLHVVVSEKAELQTWLAHQARPASPPSTETRKQGARLFLSYGCGACHTIRGTAADGEMAPDLTHVGSRVSLGAGILANDPAAYRRWISHTEKIKPAVNMPSFDMMPNDELDAIVSYLEGLD